MNDRLCQFRYADGSYCYSAVAPCPFHANVTVERSKLADRAERVREYIAIRLAECEESMASKDYDDAGQGRAVSDALLLVMQILDGAEVGS